LIYCESFDLSNINPGLGQKFHWFIDSFIMMTAGGVFLKKHHTKIYATSSVFSQILSNKIVKITRNKGYEHRKIKTGTCHLNQLAKLRKEISSIC